MARGKGMGRGRGRGQGRDNDYLSRGSDEGHHKESSEGLSYDSSPDAQHPHMSGRLSLDTHHTSEGSNETHSSNEQASTLDGRRPSKRKGRGPAVGISKPNKEDRLVIKFENGRPVRDNRNYFTTKLGIWARDQSRFPFSTLQFDHFPDEDWKDLEDLAIGYFDIQYKGDLRKLLKETCRRIWNDERSKLYRNYYACHNTHEEALLNPPKSMEEDVDEWRKICNDVFLSNTWRERSKRNSFNRSHQIILPKTGRTSFAQKKVEWRDENNRDPSRYEFFEVCFKGKDGAYVNAATKEVTELLVERVSKSPENEDQIFREVLGPERKGRKRGVGRCITSGEHDIPSMRAQIEELTKRHAERDLRDAETQRELTEIKVQMESMKQLLHQTLREQHMHVSPLQATTTKTTTDACALPATPDAWSLPPEGPCLIPVTTCALLSITCATPATCAISPGA